MLAQVARTTAAQTPFDTYAACLAAAGLRRAALARALGIGSCSGGTLCYETHDQPAAEGRRPYPEPVVPSNPSSQAWLKCFYTPKHPHMLKLPIPHELQVRRLVAAATRCNVDICKNFNFYTAATVSPRPHTWMFQFNLQPVVLLLMTP